MEGRWWRYRIDLEVNHIRSVGRSVGPLSNFSRGVTNPTPKSVGRAGSTRPDPLFNARQLRVGWPSDNPVASSSLCMRGSELSEDNLWLPS